jgi:hypothetical protein
MVDYDPPRQINPIFNPLEFRLQRATTATIQDLTIIQDELDLIAAKIQPMGFIWTPTFAQMTLVGGTGVSFVQYDTGLDPGVYVVKYTVYANLSPTSSTYIFSIGLNMNSSTQNQSNFVTFVSNNFKYQSASMVAYFTLTETEVVDFSCVVNTPFPANPSEVVTLNNPTYFPGLATSSAKGASLSIIRIK